jgi:hypothetical protein
MSKSCANIHQLLHDMYLNDKGSKFAPYAKQLDWFARSMLDKAKLTSNLERAKCLKVLLDKHMSKDSNNAEHREEATLIFNLLSECFEVILDDLMLLSAFEMYAKGQLLRKGYLIHAIREPTSLCKKQRTKPIHIRTIRAMNNKGENIEFSEKTIGIGYLVKATYISKYPIGSTALDGLSKIRDRRNLVHFNTGMAWAVSKELLEFVECMDTVIPKHKNRNRKGDQRSIG